MQLKKVVMVLIVSGILLANTAFALEITYPSSQKPGEQYNIHYYSAITVSGRVIKPAEHNGESGPNYVEIEVYYADKTAIASTKTSPLEEVGNSKYLYFSETLEAPAKGWTLGDIFDEKGFLSIEVFTKRSATTYHQGNTMKKR